MIVPACLILVALVGNALCVAIAAHLSEVAA
jgi:hypothetical protein